jgi:hypothetical protein
MGDVLEVQQFSPDIVVLTVRGPLSDLFDRSSPNRLIQVISRFIFEQGLWGRVFVVDLSEGSSLDELDVAIIQDAHAKVAAVGGLLVVVDPDGYFPWPRSKRIPNLRSRSRPISRFKSREDAVMSARNETMPVAVQIFLDDESVAPEVEGALRAVLNTFGITDPKGLPPVHGSWYRQISGRIRRVGAAESGEDLARAIDIQLVQRYQAGIDSAASDAVANLITALEKTPGAVIQAGSILLVKYDSAVIVRQLTQREMTYWQDNPGLFKDPRRALLELQHADRRYDAESPQPTWGDEDPPL